MKRLLSLVLCFALLLSIPFLSASAANIVDSGTCGANVTWSLDGRGTLTINGNGEMNNFGTDGGPWRDGWVSVMCVVINSGVTSIGNYAFSNCTHLNSVTISSSVTRIGDGAFYGCTELRYTQRYTSQTSFTIPNEVTSIGDDAFYGCTGLTEITIPEHVTHIGDRAFCDCTALRDVYFRGNAPETGNQVFQIYDKNKNTYSNSSYLTLYYVDGKEGWTTPTWGEEAYYTTPWDGVNLSSSGRIDNLTWTLDPSGVLTVSGTGRMRDYSEGYPAPWGHTVKTVVIENGVTFIGAYAFTGCTELTSISIPSSVSGIGAHAFHGCAGLTSIVIPQDATFIGASAFSGCTGLTSIMIPQNATFIGASAFFECTGLTSITIPSSVKDIGAFTFYECTGLTSITISNGVTSIGNDAFVGCTGLASITIPSSVTSIGESAFFECTGLKNVVIPNGVTSIETNAFYGCTSLTSATISNGITSIGDSAFCRCTSLKSVTIPASVTSIGDSAFYGRTDLKSVTISDSVAKIKAFAFSWCVGLTSVIIPPSVTYIGDNAFYSCTALTGVYFGGNAPKIGNSVFRTYDKGLRDDANLPNLMLYYIEGKAGWTTPTWSKDHYQTATWSGVNTSTSEFSDVSPAAWYAGAVNYAVSNKLMNGMGGGKFEPNGSMTRAMLVTVLWRYAGSPAEGTNGFSDVPNGDWYTQAGAWASKNGVVNGVGSGRFDPNGKVTREQMAVILFRYANQQGINTGKRGDFGKFADANKVSGYAVDALQWAVAEGIVGGSSEGGKLLLNPQGNATRAEVATILMRFLENVMK